MHLPTQKHALGLQGKYYELLLLLRNMKLIRKSLDQLIKEKYDFFIPDYQRGYKWTRTEVLKLLNDIWDFKLNHSDDDDGDFYCLQPVVVKPKDGKYYVIDGQQRLTTLLIIQQAMKDYGVTKLHYTVLANHPELASELMPTLTDVTYSIEYQTRNKSSVWLESRCNEDEMQKNSDYFHIFRAYNATLDFMKWIDADTPDDYTLDNLSCPKSKKRINAVTEFETCIRSKCHVIWYELDTENENDHEIFDRLNTGKIPLTNAELIKAMLLQEGNFPSLSDDVKIKSEDYRTNLARQWDEIERKLQDPFFWDFIYDNNVGMSYETRIEYLFDLLANKEKSNSDRYYFTFEFYDSLFQKNKENGDDAIEFVNKEWKRVRELIQTMQDWYDNKTYYHYIGYLISQGHSVNEIKNIQFPQDKDGKALPVPKKAEFIKKLEELIRKQTSSYESKDLMKSQKGLTPTLLLFNVLTVLDNSEKSDRFPFHYYKQTPWNEEHVAPNTPFDPNKKSRCFQFAAQMLEYYTDISYFEVIEDLTATNIKIPKNERKSNEQLVSEAIDIVKPKYEEYISQMEDSSICKALFKIFLARGKEQEELSQYVFSQIVDSMNIKDSTLNEEDDRRDFIWNQVLLDEGTNKSYGNAIFPYKRMRVIKNITRGVFVPIGTYNVFVKAYSHRMTNMLEWDENDALRYLAEIFNTLNRSGRNFLNKELLIQNNLPEYVKCNELLKLIRHEQ